jgi:hypothetical protein
MQTDLHGRDDKLTVHVVIAQHRLRVENTKPIFVQAAHVCIFSYRTLHAFNPINPSEFGVNFSLLEQFNTNFAWIKWLSNRRIGCDSVFEHCHTERIFPTSHYTKEK